MIAQPQALAQHLAHGLSDGVLAPIAGNGLDFGPGGPQPRLQGVGGVQYLTDGTLMRVRPTPQGQGGGNGHDGEKQEEQGVRHGAVQGREGRLQSERFRSPSPNPRADRGLGLTGAATARSILRLMSAHLPEMLDAWRMVTARRGVEGRLPLSALTRLRDSLLDTEGEVRFALDFDRDELQVPYVELRIEAGLPLVCQRSLERFLLPVNIVQRLGLIRDEADEAALPPGYEPLLVPEDGMLRPSELVEDELILAIPVVPMAPGTDAMERDWPADEAEQERANPFAALAALKHKK